MTITFLLFPGRGAACNDAPQTRDRNRLITWDDPGSAVHHFVLHRIRETDCLPFSIQRNPDEPS